MTTNLKQVICMKWGDLYGPEYVNRLYAMVKRNTHGSLRFVCLTDDPTQLHPEIEYYDCPVVDIPMPHRLRGWRKLSLFSPTEQLFSLSGTWLYLDLDIVITGALDDFFSYEPNKPFVVMRNWSQESEKIGNTSVYRFHIGNDSYLLTDLLDSEKQKQIFATFRNSQTYISHNIKQLTFWPDSWCILFKVHCLPAWPQRFWQQPHLPENTKVVAFPGNPNPDEAMAGNWPATWYKKIYKHVRPTQWIKELWSE